MHGVNTHGVKYVYRFKYYSSNSSIIYLVTIIQF